MAVKYCETNYMPIWALPWFTTDNKITCPHFNKTFNWLVSCVLNGLIVDLFNIMSMGLIYCIYINLHIRPHPMKAGVTPNFSFVSKLHAWCNTQSHKIFGCPGCIHFCVKQTNFIYDYINIFSRYLTIKIKMLLIYNIHHLILSENLVNCCCGKHIP